MTYLKYDKKLLSHKRETRVTFSRCLRGKELKRNVLSLVEKLNVKSFRHSLIIGYELYPSLPLYIYYKGRNILCYNLNMNKK